MTLDQFAALTQRVISRDGFDEFLPTARFPARRHVATLVGLPAGTQPEAPVLEWASRDARAGEEFLVAFKVDDARFKVIRRAGDRSESRTYAVDSPH